MTLTIPAHVYGTKRQTFIATIFCSLILCVLCRTPVHAVAAANKTDAELTKAVVGTWEAFPIEGGFSKQFVTLNADGTCKVISIFNAQGGPKRSEGEGKWHVSHGYLIAQAIKSPHDTLLPIRFNTHAKIESIENGVVKERDEKGEQGELRRIGQLPSLPPLLKPPEELGKLATYRPQPEYPVQARAQHSSGRGFFILRVTIQTGVVKDVQVAQSTGSPTLDSAAISAFKRWRFKPGALSPIKIFQLNLPERSVIKPEDIPVRVPVHFAMSRKS
jgi:TonB family protein